MRKSFIKKNATLAIVVVACMGVSELAAQDCYSVSGCSDFSNFGYSSSGADDLEYDNYVSGFHSTVVRDLDGTFKIWGEMSQADGYSSYLMPTPINPGNYPGLTGNPLKAAIGSGTIGNVQFILLTDDDKLWTWGRAGALLDPSLTTNISVFYDGDYIDIAPFQEFSLGLPSGIAASDVKMMFATNGTLLITTCGGEVYFITDYWGNSGSGSTSDVNVWAKVKKTTMDGTSDLTGIVAARGCPYGFIALDETGNLWTWGYETWDGVNPRTHRSAAEQMALPADATGSVKMVGMTGGSGTAYCLLYEDGNLYTLGDNDVRQLGDWTTANRQTWVQPRYTSASGPVMNDIKWISPQEHDGIYSNVSVINEDKKILNWGEEDKSNLGRGMADCYSSTSALDPGEPVGFSEGYDNSGIIAIETGGHTLMAMRECESNFGYVGHRVNGSMGDNDPVDECDDHFHFATSAVEVCGAVVVDATLNSSVEGPYYVGNSLTLLSNPSGGTYSISTTSTGTATLTDSTLTFTGAGTVRVEYTIVTSDCGSVTVSKTFNVEESSVIITIPGQIWIDANGDAEIDGTETGTDNDMWVNLVDPDGIVISSVKVNADGTYQFEISDGDLSLAGDYSAILTQSSRYKGDLLTGSDEASGEFEYTGTNRGSGTGNTANTTGVINAGDLSVISTTTTTDPVNFGIQRPPVADPKEFSVDHSSFSDVPPVGFPVVSDYQSIPLSSPDLTGYPTGGSLSGSDPEDCPDPSDCNTGTGTTFTIHSINSNTKVYYDFGDGTPVEIEVTGGSVNIPDFDVTKMVIYGANGSGDLGDELGFTYSLTDKAGSTSVPVNYAMTLSGPLPVSLAYFGISKVNQSVLLEWSTFSESNNRGFEIERSIDSRLWDHIGWTATKADEGNSSKQLTYTFVDHQPNTGTNFYRLKQVDHNGSHTYSPVQMVYFENLLGIFIVPNPTKGRTTINNLPEGKNQITVMNNSGQVLMRKEVMNLTEYTIDMSVYASGTYHIHVKDESGNVINQKVVKQ
ncbi:MAG: T9SS type A sorting domain-containing protein [Taibaiella sp.]|nr:T9SS type A sorting domain-containing protein [Taibaiella sp.]